MKLIMRVAIPATIIINNCNKLFSNSYILTPEIKNRSFFWSFTGRKKCNLKGLIIDIKYGNNNL